jgi:hypothetical protein
VVDDTTNDGSTAGMEFIFFMAPFKNLVLLAVLVVLAVQLEFIFHISEPLLYHWRQLLERLVNTVFIVGFLLWVYLAYEIEKLKRLLCEYSYINYKKSDEWEREIATTTNEELRKLTDSEEYKQWQRARK